MNAHELTERGGSALEAVRNLPTKTDTERTIQSQALQVCNELAQRRARLSQRDDDSIPRPFLVVLGFWLAVLFASFGLFAPRNATVIAVLFVSSLSVAGAVFLIVDMDQPFGGLIQISCTPLKNVLSQIGQ